MFISLGTMPVMGAEADGKGVAVYRLPPPVRYVIAALLLGFTVPRQLPTLKSGDALAVIVGALVVAFWLWVAWTVVRSGDRTRARYWRQTLLGWLVWLMLALIICAVAFVAGRLNPVGGLYVAIPLLGTLSCWFLMRRLPREGPATQVDVPVHSTE